MRNFLAIKDMKKGELLYLIRKSKDIKKNPKKYEEALEDKTLLMIFEAPSLRTRLSFETAMLQVDGHAIFYTTGESTLGKKESMKEFSQVISRYVDVVMARLFSHDDLLELAKYSTVPVINGMTNMEHPCQIAGDLLTMNEKRKTRKIAYVGDCNNNVTNSLLYAAAILGIDIAIASPKGKEFEPVKSVVNECRRMSKKEIMVTNDPKKAVKNADVVYTDSWMSYRVPKERESFRLKKLKPYQVNSKLMKYTNNAIFMHCLPAKRGHEVTDEVMDSSASVIIDQAENRLHAQKAILLWCLE